MIINEKLEKLGSTPDILALENMPEKRAGRGKTGPRVLPNREYKPFAMKKIIKGRVYWYIYQAIITDGKRKLKMVKYCGVLQPTKREVQSAIT